MDGRPECKRPTLREARSAVWHLVQFFGTALPAMPSLPCPRCHALAAMPSLPCPRCYAFAGMRLMVSFSNSGATSVTSEMMKMIVE